MHFRLRIRIAEPCRYLYPRHHSRRMLLVVSAGDFAAIATLECASPNLRLAEIPFRHAVSLWAPYGTNALSQ